MWFWGGEEGCECVCYEKEVWAEVCVLGGRGGEGICVCCGERGVDRGGVCVFATFWVRCHLPTLFSVVVMLCR